MFSFLIIGTILGLSAGFAPGPLLALVVSETLQHDIKAGVKVALAPVLTDLPIILFTIFILSKLSSYQRILGLISIGGACFICYLGIVHIRTERIDLRGDSGTPKSLRKGFLANVLSPHPYLFWITVGGPTTLKAMNFGLFAAGIFVLSFYLMLIGSKIGIALLVGQSRTFLQGRKYIRIMRFLGILLIILAAMLFRDGMQMLGIF